MKKHLGNFEDCSYCRNYIRLGASFGEERGYTATTRRLHKVAMTRRAKDQVYKDLGLVKVRGALGGTYWE